jgi:hypothetical protein
MAKGYRAVSNIRHGVANSDGVEVRVVEIPYGSIVTGLDNTTMKQLWDIGVLEEFDIPEVTMTTRDVVTDPVVPQVVTPVTTLSGADASEVTGPADQSGSSDQGEPPLAG